MANEPGKFLIVLRTGSSKPRPQHQSLHLAGKPWLIEWSTHSEIPMAIDYFNITIGRYLKSDTLNEDGTPQKRIEEYWRLTGISPGTRKIQYGINPPEATSTPAKPLEDGIYAIKITGMTILAVGLEVQTAIGIGLVKIETAGTAAETGSEIPEAADVQTSAVKPEEAAHTQVAVTGETITKLLNILDDEESSSR